MPNCGAVRGAPPPTVRRASGTRTGVKVQLVGGPLTSTPVSTSRLNWPAWLCDQPAGLLGITRNEDVTQLPSSPAAGVWKRARQNHTTLSRLATVVGSVGSHSASTPAVTVVFRSVVAEAKLGSVSNSNSYTRALSFGLFDCTARRGVAVAAIANSVGFRMVRPPVRKVKSICAALLFSFNSAILLSGSSTTRKV